MKRKRIASISMAHIEDIGELEGKKSLFEDILVSFKAKEIWKEPGDFRLDFQVLPSVPWQSKLQIWLLIYIVKIV